MKFSRSRKPVDFNPRSRKYRGDPIWMFNAVWLMKRVNVATGAMIIFALMLLVAVKL